MDLQQPEGFPIGARVVCVSKSYNAPVGLTGTVSEGNPDTQGWMVAMLTGNLVFVKWDEGINIMVDEDFPEGTWEPVNQIEVVESDA